MTIAGPKKKSSRTPTDRTHKHHYNVGTETLPEPKCEEPNAKLFTFDRNHQNICQRCIKRIEKEERIRNELVEQLRRG